MGALRNEIAELVGMEGLEALANARGGRRARIPKRVTPGHWLERAVGAGAAAKLAFRYGGCRLYIPRTPPATDRDRRILDLRLLGRSVPEIARATGLSYRRVQQILARGRSE